MPDRFQLLSVIMHSYVKILARVQHKARSRRSCIETYARISSKNMPLVSVIMGSKSDYDHMSDAISTLKEFGVNVEAKVVSAHRTPELMYEYASSARERGIEVIIAGAGGAAHLPGMTASMTTLPVIGVPVPTRNLKGIDSLLSIVQMPSGIPVATVAIGNSRNAALLALRILSIKHDDIRAKVSEFMEKQKESVLKQKLEVD